MNEETLTALKGGIEKWEAIVEGTGIDEGVANCPLCQLFNKNLNPYPSCGECPTNCDGDSPYRNWDTHIINVHSHAIKKIYCPTCEGLAQAELDHLKSLLPKK